MEKSAFGVREGKLLGFLASQRGIETNPEKLGIILEMEAPCP
jgi:hypothetical protein